MKKTIKKDSEVLIKKPKVVKETKADIYNGNEFVRTYSLEIHGKDFDKLADSFINKTGYEKRA